MRAPFIINLFFLFQFLLLHLSFFFFFFNDTATTEIYTLSLHDALPIFESYEHDRAIEPVYSPAALRSRFRVGNYPAMRSEEHTSELQSQSNLVCRLLLEKKKKKIIHSHSVSQQTHMNYVT